MRDRKIFKIIFWVLTAIIFGILIGCLILININPFNSVDEDILIANILLVFSIILMAIVFLTIGAFVYKDAKKRNMNEWMWLTIALYVPNFIGLIIYIIVRQNYNKKCFSCGAKVEENFEVCPFCGKELKRRCENCNNTINEDWVVCPYCKKELLSKNNAG